MVKVALPLEEISFFPEKMEPYVIAFLFKLHLRFENSETACFRKVF